MFRLFSSPCLCAYETERTACESLDQPLDCDFGAPEDRAASANELGCRSRIGGIRPFRVQVIELCEIAGLDGSPGPMVALEGDDDGGDAVTFLRHDAEILGVEIEGEILVKSQMVFLDQGGMDD